MELEALTAAFWCSAATVMMLHISAQVSKNLLVAIVAAFIFAFCSPILSTASRGLWQHGPLVVGILATMLLLHSAVRRPNLIVLAGFTVAAAVVCRPLSAPFVVLVSGYVALYHRDRFFHFMVAGGIVAIVWGAYNYAIWKSLVSPYLFPTAYLDDFSHWRGRILGPLISPGRGLFVFCPIFLFSIVGVTLKVRTHNLDRFDVLYIAAIFCCLIVVALTPAWWAGDSFGPRYLTDIVPFLVYLMFPALSFVSKNFQRRSGSVTAVLMGLSIAISLFINIQGAVNFATSLWNVDPVQEGVSPEGYARLWDWRDLQFLRGTTFEKPLLWRSFLYVIRSKSKR